VSGSVLSEEKVALVAIALKGLPENSEKSIEELLAPACRLLLAIPDIAEIENRKYQLRRNQERSQREQLMADPEAVNLFMPKEKDADRGLERLNEFKEFMKNPVELAGDVYLENLWQTRPREFESGNWTYGLCLELKEYFPKWETIKGQRRAKKDAVSPLTDTAKGLAEEDEGQPE
jgi:hypothetical protein